MVALVWGWFPVGDGADTLNWGLRRSVSLTLPLKWSFPQRWNDRRLLLWWLSCGYQNTAGEQMRVLGPPLTIVSTSLLVWPQHCCSQQCLLSSQPELFCISLSTKYTSCICSSGKGDVRGVIMYFQTTCLISNPPHTFIFRGTLASNLLSFSGVLSWELACFCWGTSFRLSLISWVSYHWSICFISFWILLSPFMCFHHLLFSFGSCRLKRHCSGLWRNQRYACLMFPKVTGFLPRTLNPNLWISMCDHKIVLSQISKRDKSVG